MLCSKCQIYTRGRLRSVLNVVALHSRAVGVVEWMRMLMVLMVCATNQAEAGYWIHINFLLSRSIEVDIGRYERSSDSSVHIQKVIDAHENTIMLSQSIDNTLFRTNLKRMLNCIHRVSDTATSHDQKVKSHLKIDKALNSCTL